jgi:hypothetical protein
MIPTIPIIPSSFRLCRNHSKKSNSLRILVEMLPQIYSKAVLAYYHQKLAVNDLSIGIRQLSPASLKAACLEECRERYDRKDERILKRFFGDASDQTACLLAIADLEIDKFRPLVYFIKGKTKNPDDKVVELVAWLIGFKDRPYDHRKKYTITTDDPQGLPSKMAIEVVPAAVGKREAVQLPVPPGAIEETPKTMPLAAIYNSKSQANARTNRNKTVFTVAIGVVVALIIYLAWPKKVTLPGGPQGCMYWTGDHYKAIPCDQRTTNALTVSLDSARLVYFRKITRPDTITENALGSIWYAKFQGKYECYTAPGAHPIDASVPLKLLTDYVLLRHIHPQPASVTTPR